MLFVALALFAVVVSPPSPIVMSTASFAASTSSVITVSSGASGSSTAPTSTAASVLPGASSSSSGLYSQLLRSLDDSTRRQIEAAMAQALPSPSARLRHDIRYATICSHSLSCTHTRARLLQAPPMLSVCASPASPPFRSIPHFSMS